MRKIYILTFILTLLYSVTAIGQPERNNTSHNVVFPVDLSDDWASFRFSTVDAATYPGDWLVDGYSNNGATAGSNHVVWTIGDNTSYRDQAYTYGQFDDGRYAFFQPRSSLGGELVTLTELTSNEFTLTTETNTYLYFDFATDFRKNDYVQADHGPNAVQGYDAADVSVEVTFWAGTGATTNTLVWRDDMTFLADTDAGGAAEDVWTRKRYGRLEDANRTYEETYETVESASEYIRMYGQTGPDDNILNGWWGTQINLTNAVGMAANATYSVTVSFMYEEKDPDLSTGGLFYLDNIGIYTTTDAAVGPGTGASAAIASTEWHDVIPRANFDGFVQMPYDLTAEDGYTLAADFHMFGGPIDDIATAIATYKIQGSTDPRYYLAFAEFETIAAGAATHEAVYPVPWSYATGYYSENQTFVANTGTVEANVNDPVNAIFGIEDSYDLKDVYPNFKFERPVNSVISPYFKPAGENIYLFSYIFSENTINAFDRGNQEDLNVIKDRWRLDVNGTRLSKATWKDMPIAPLESPYKFTDKHTGSDISGVDFTETFIGEKIILPAKSRLPLSHVEFNWSSVNGATLANEEYTIFVYQVDENESLVTGTPLVKVDAQRPQLNEEKVDLAALLGQKESIYLGDLTETTAYVIGYVSKNNVSLNTNVDTKTHWTNEYFYITDWADDDLTTVDATAGKQFFQDRPEKQMADGALHMVLHFENKPPVFEDPPSNANIINAPIELPQTTLVFDIADYDDLTENLKTGYTRFAGTSLENTRIFDLEYYFGADENNPADFNNVTVSIDYHNDGAGTITGGDARTMTVTVTFDPDIDDVNAYPNGVPFTLKAIDDRGDITEYTVTIRPTEFYVQSIPFVETFDEDSDIPGGWPLDPDSGTQGEDYWNKSNWQAAGEDGSVVICEKSSDQNAAIETVRFGPLEDVNPDSIRISFDYLTDRSGGKTNFNVSAGLYNYNGVLLEELFDLSEDYGKHTVGAGEERTFFATFADLGLVDETEWLGDDCYVEFMYTSWGGDASKKSCFGFDDFMVAYEVSNPFKLELVDFSITVPETNFDYTNELLGYKQLEEFVVTATVKNTGGYANDTDVDFEFWMNLGETLGNVDGMTTDDWTIAETIEIFAADPLGPSQTATHTYTITKPLLASMGDGDPSTAGGLYDKDEDSGSEDTDVDVADNSFTFEYATWNFRTLYQYDGHFADLDWYYGPLAFMGHNEVETIDFSISPDVQAPYRYNFVGDFETVTVDNTTGGSIGSLIDIPEHNSPVTLKNLAFHVKGDLLADDNYSYSISIVDITKPQLEATPNSGKLIYTEEYTLNIPAGYTAADGYWETVDFNYAPYLYGMHTASQLGKNYAVFINMANNEGDNNNWFGIAIDKVDGGEAFGTHLYAYQPEVFEDINFSQRAGALRMKYYWDEDAAAVGAPLYGTCEHIDIVKGLVDGKEYKDVDDKDNFNEEDKYFFNTTYHINDPFVYDIPICVADPESYDVRARWGYRIDGNDTIELVGAHPSWIDGELVELFEDGKTTYVWRMTGFIDYDPTIGDEDINVNNPDDWRGDNLVILNFEYKFKAAGEPWNSISGNMPFIVTVEDRRPWVDVAFKDFLEVPFVPYMIPNEQSDTLAFTLDAKYENTSKAEEAHTYSIGTKVVRYITMNDGSDDGDARDVKKDELILTTEAEDTLAVSASKDMMFPEYTFAYTANPKAGDDDANKYEIMFNTSVIDGKIDMNMANNASEEYTMNITDTTLVNYIHYDYNETVALETLTHTNYHLEIDPLAYAGADETNYMQTVTVNRDDYLTSVTLFLLANKDQHDLTAGKGDDNGKDGVTEADFDGNKFYLTILDENDSLLWKSPDYDVKYFDSDNLEAGNPQKGEYPYASDWRRTGIRFTQGLDIINSQFVYKGFELKKGKTYKFIINDLENNDDPLLSIMDVAGLPYMEFGFGEPVVQCWTTPADLVEEDTDHGDVDFAGINMYYETAPFVIPTQGADFDWEVLEINAETYSGYDISKTLKWNNADADTDADYPAFYKQGTPDENAINNIVGSFYDGKYDQTYTVRVSQSDQDGCDHVFDIYVFDPTKQLNSKGKYCVPLQSHIDWQDDETFGNENESVHSDGLFIKTVDTEMLTFSKIFDNDKRGWDLADSKATVEYTEYTKDGDDVPDEYEAWLMTAPVVLPNLEDYYDECYVLDFNYERQLNAVTKDGKETGTVGVDVAVKWSVDGGLTWSDLGNATANKTNFETETHDVLETATARFRVDAAAIAAATTEGFANTVRFAIVMDNEEQSGDLSAGKDFIIHSLCIYKQALKPSISISATTAMETENQPTLIPKKQLSCDDDYAVTVKIKNGNWIDNFSLDIYEGQYVANLLKQGTATATFDTILTGKEGTVKLTSVFDAVETVYKENPDIEYDVVSEMWDDVKGKYPNSDPDFELYVTKWEYGYDKVGDITNMVAASANPEVDFTLCDDDTLTKVKLYLDTKTLEAGEKINVYLENTDADGNRIGFSTMTKTFEWPEIASVTETASSTAETTVASAEMTFEGAVVPAWLADDATTVTETDIPVFTETYMDNKYEVVTGTVFETVTESITVTVPVAGGAEKTVEYIVETITGTTKVTSTTTKTVDLAKNEGEDEWTDEITWMAPVSKLGKENIPVEGAGWYYFNFYEGIPVAAGNLKVIVTADDDNTDGFKLYADGTKAKVPKIRTIFGNKVPYLYDVDGEKQEIVYIGETFSHQYYVKDENPATCEVYSKTFVPDWITFNVDADDKTKRIFPSHLVYGIPTDDDIGLNYLTLMVEDEIGQVGNSKALTVEVRDLPSPEFSTAPVIHINEGGMYSYMPKADAKLLYGRNPRTIDATVQVSPDRPLPSWLTLVDGVLTGTAPEFDEGTVHEYEVELQATYTVTGDDGAEYTREAKQFFRVKVYKNVAPVIEGLSDWEAEAGASIMFNAYASDVNQHDVLTIFGEGMDIVNSSDMNGKAMVTIASAPEGETEYTVYVTDGIDTSMTTFTVNTYTNAAPSLAITGEASVEAGTGIEIMLEGTDTDSDYLEYIITDAPSFLTLQGNKLIGSSTKAGTYTVKAIVSDGIVESEVAEFTFDITSTPLAIEGVADITVSLGEAISDVVFTATGGTGDYTFKVQLPSWASFMVDGDMVSIMGTPTEATAGIMDGAQYPVQVIVNDGMEKVVESFIITVNNPDNVGIEANSLSGLSMYPNPVKSMLFVDNAAGSVASVISITGKVVKVINIEDVNAAINVADLTPGAYMLRVVKGDAIVNNKFIKE